MRRGFKKLESVFHKKRGKHPENSVAATPSRESVLPNEQIQSTSGVPLPRNQPTLPSSEPSVPPKDPIIAPSGGITHPNEPTPRPPRVAALPIEPTASSSQLTAPASETVIPPNETNDSPSQITPPAPELTDPSSTKRNFWKEAVEMLPKGYKVPKEWETIKFDKGEMVDIVNTKKEECTGDQWKFKIKGKEVVVRDLFEKTLVWVQKFAAVGDTAVQYDPVNAALPWAGFRFLLQMATNEMEIYRGMVAGLERATWLVFYCSAQERLYEDYFADNDKYSGLNRAFLEDLVHLYAATLKFLIEAHNYYAKDPIVRMVGSVLTPSTWVTELMRAIDNRKLRMEDYANLVHKSNVHKDLKSVLREQELVSKYVSEEETRLHEKERKRFMEWLSDVDYRGDHKANSRNILKDSGDWMLSREEKFNSWKEEGTVLWLRGIPGAGKTKLTSTVIDHLTSSKENHTVAYFYCIRDAQHPKHTDPEEILRAILKQLVILLPSQCSDPVKAKYEQERRGGKDHGSIGRLTFEGCVDSILELASDRPVTIVIDALDECQENKRQSSQGSHTDRQDLLNQLEKMMGAKPGNIKVFLSSRDDEDISHRLKKYPTITLDTSKNGVDIQHFIESEVDGLMRDNIRWGKDEQLKGEIISAVNDRADGMFRFAALQIGYLSSLPTRSKVRERLLKLPKTLRELYDEIYQRISGIEEEAEPSIAKRALSWLLCARRQLHSRELLAAVSPDLDELVSGDELLHICRHLIVLNDVYGSFEFAHLTVREYLEAREEYKDGQPHALIAERCIQIFEPGVPRGVLDQYASLYWPDHYSSVPQMEDNTLTDVVKEFFRNKGVNEGFEAWAKAAEDSSKSLSWDDDLRMRIQDTKYKPLSVVCVFGFPKLLGQWMDSPPEISYFQHPDLVVHLAIKWGNEGVVCLLLRNDAQPAVDRFGWTALVWASVYEQIPVLEALKELYGNVDAKDEVGWTALHWMVFLGHMEGLRILLGAGAGLNLIDQAEWTPLHWAAFIGRDTEAKELVVGGHGLDAKDHDKLTPFQWAKFVGNEATVEHLGTSAADDSFSPTLPRSQDVRMLRLEPHGAFLTV